MVTPMNILKTSAVLAIAGLLAACAQQEEPTGMVAPEPVFDKYGGGACSDGYVYVPGTAVQPPSCVPEECEGTLTSTAAQVPCPPPPPRREDDDQPSGRQPTGTAPVN